MNLSIPSTDEQEKTLAKPMKTPSRGAENIHMLVPRAHLELAKGKSSLYAAPLNIQAYDHFHRKYLDDPDYFQGIIVVFARDLVGNFTIPQLAQFLQDETRKILILASQQEMEALVEYPVRGIDILALDNLRELWAYRINRFVHELIFDTSVSQLRKRGEKRQTDLDTLNQIGVALSTEKSLSHLLDIIVQKSREMTWADAGTLYLIENDPELEENPRDYFANKRMRFEVAQNYSRNVPFKANLMEIKPTSIYGYVAMTQKILNFEDVYHLDPNAPYSWGGKGFDKAIAYRTKSMLTLPMVNWRNETVGVIQLINRKTDAKIKLETEELCTKYVRPFDTEEEEIANSIASQASIAIQNAQLVKSITDLFEGFIAASVKAIESRDITTSGHSQRVADLSIKLAEKVDQTSAGTYGSLVFSLEMLRELRYAALLHDFGKIGVREHVLQKSKKLYPDQLDRIEARFELVRCIIETEYAHTIARQYASPGKTADLQKFCEAAKRDRDQKTRGVERALAIVRSCNEPTIQTADTFQGLEQVATMSYLDRHGKVQPFLTPEEVESLRVPKGSLSAFDRLEVESHVSHTYNFLKTIPWTPGLTGIPDIAHAHHEKLDGSGYPLKLKSPQISVQSRIITIADIFDALTARDRPYKKAIPAERALNILEEEASMERIDRDLLKIFAESKIHHS